MPSISLFPLSPPQTPCLPAFASGQHCVWPKASSVLSSQSMVSPQHSERLKSQILIYVCPLTQLPIFMKTTGTQHLRNLCHPPRMVKTVSEFTSRMGLTNRYTEWSPLRFFSAMQTINNKKTCKLLCSFVKKKKSQKASISEKYQVIPNSAREGAKATLSIFREVHMLPHNSTHWILDTQNFAHFP